MVSFCCYRFHSSEQTIELYQTLVIDLTVVIAKIMRKHLTVILGRNGSDRSYEVQSIDERRNLHVAPLDLSAITNYIDDNPSPSSGFSTSVETSPIVSPFRRSELFKSSSRSMQYLRKASNTNEQEKPKEKERRLSSSPRLTAQGLGQAFTKSKERLEKRYSTPLRTRKDSKLRSGSETGPVAGEEVGIYL